MLSVWEKLLSGRATSWPPPSRLPARDPSSELCASTAFTFLAYSSNTILFIVRAKSMLTSLISCDVSMSLSFSRLELSP